MPPGAVTVNFGQEIALVFLIKISLPSCPSIECVPANVQVRGFEIWFFSQLQKDCKAAAGKRWLPRA